MGATVSSYTSSSLTLRAVLKSAAGRIGMGTPANRVAGLTSPAKAMCAAVAASRTPAVLVVANDAEVERMTVDARFFVAALEGVSQADVERAVAPLPVARGRSVPRPEAAFRHRVGSSPRTARHRVWHWPVAGGVRTGAPSRVSHSRSG